MGQRYGHLMVIGPAENIGTWTAWRCHCDCGKKVIVSTRHLRSGHTKNCGCLGSSANFDDAVKARKRGEEDLHDTFLREFAAHAAPADG